MRSVAMDAVRVRRSASTENTVSSSRLDEWTLFTRQYDWVAGPTDAFRKVEGGPVYYVRQKTYPLPTSIITAIALLKLAKKASASRLRLKRDLDTESLCVGKEASLLVPFEELAYANAPDTLSPIEALRRAMAACLHAYEGHIHVLARLTPRSTPEDYDKVIAYYEKLRLERLAAVSASLQRK